MDDIFDVIIVGGGPVGITLAIELGLNNIKTLVLEKYLDPLLSPRAQSLSSRSMEFLLRLGISEKLKNRQVLPENLPHQGVWCSKLNGTTYGIGAMNLALNDSISPEKYLRIPLWHTEEVLRNKLSQLNSVKFIKQVQVNNVSLLNKQVIVLATHQGQQLEYKSQYAVGCDGAKSITRNSLNINFIDLAPAKRVINILFETDELDKNISVSRGFIYFLLDNKYPSVVGLVDPTQNLWYSQIVYDNETSDINAIDLDSLLNEITGISFKKKIVQSHFWDMQPQIAEKFSYEKRIFLAGDSAHAFVPTGGFGLNTGLTGALNLAWKLAAVVKHEAHPSLLDTYEIERRPIALRNLEAAQQNAQTMVEIRHKYDPKTDPTGFAKANSEAATIHSQSLGLAMGYAYYDSPLTKLNLNQITIPTLQSIYIPKFEPGYFLPHTILDNNNSIYTKLSNTKWTLIIASNSDINLVKDWLELAQQFKMNVETLNISHGINLKAYTLIRPDWHIAFTSDQLDDEYLTNNWQKF